jgi:hypothetical protein
MNTIKFANNVINSAFLEKNKTLKKYLAIIERGNIEESEIISMRSLMNKNKPAREAIFEAMQDKTLTLSASQNQKGIDFLLNAWKTPRGKERSNSPFGYREEKILDNFSHFELKSFYNAGNSYIDNYLPLYECISNDGNSFEYYYNGKVNIIG